jgi:hypothetical protein
MTLRRLLGLVGAVVLLAAGAAIARGGQQQVATTGCTADATKVLVRSFARNYGAARVALINRMFAPKPRFQWYSTGKPGERIGRPSYVRSNLARYFRSRVRVHERLRITELGAGYDPARDIVNFAGKLVRSADDIRPRRSPHDFKGAADCVVGRPTLIVWSM